MDPEDYFGHVSVPSDEEEEDAANDLTFGDTSDIKAGDDSSDMFWKSTHHTLSSKIEAEKNAINRSRLHTTVEEVSNAPSLNFNETLSNTTTSDIQQAQTTWQSLPQPSQIPSISPIRQPNPATLSSPSGALSNTPQLHPLSLTDHLRKSPPLVVHPLAAAAALPQSTFPAQQQPQNIAQLTSAFAHDDYIRTLLSFEDTRVKTALQAHETQVADQLRKALVAQQAGVSFDRGKFDDHQNAVRQRIITDHYVRLHQIRMVAWHRQQQQQQQLLQRQRQQSQQQLPLPQDPIQRSQPIQNQQPTLLPGISQPGMPSALSLPQQNTLNTTQHLHNGLMTNASKEMEDIAAAIVDTDDRDIDPLEGVDVNDGMKLMSANLRDTMDKAPARLLEIERQMAEAGLGPRGKKSAKENMAQFVLMKQQNGDTNQSQKLDGKERRLESMTDKDQELVFRVHLRQIESSVVYKDDYYNTLKGNKQRLSGDEMFHSMARKVQELRERARQSGKEPRPFRGRRPKKTSANGVHLGTPSSPSDQNMKALANSLGTVQSWNPRAPRRVMDFAHGKGHQQRTLRDDERIFVKLEIERGYDIIACIHDILRGESYESLEGQIRMLKSTLDLEGKSEQNSYLGDESSRYRIFGMMCSQVKGRLYLLRVTDLLDSIERIQILPAFFEYLGVLTTSPRSSKNHDNAVCTKLLDTIMATLYDADLHAIDCINVLDAFYLGHCISMETFVNALRDAKACKLVFTCTQRISRGLQKDEILNDELTSTKIEQLSEMLVNSLHELFDAAESEERVWELIASVDSLIKGKRQAMYRSELGHLLQRGVIPKPPIQ